jgi:hypothetical protein
MDERERLRVFGEYGVKAPGTMSPNLGRCEGLFPPSRLLAKNNFLFASEPIVVQPQVELVGPRLVRGGREPFGDAVEAHGFSNCRFQTLDCPLFLKANRGERFRVAGPGRRCVKRQRQRGGVVDAVLFS